jgi:16S rRNA A1518/A1519 N6-dimethyltransferase RsmA/KsgA/DIM1 with predicted DNA glycosylase/AP lyase activity
MLQKEVVARMVAAPGTTEPALSKANVRRMTSGDAYSQKDYVFTVIFPLCSD